MTAASDLPWLHEPIERLNNALAQGRLAHGYLLAGAAGLGKRRIADWFERRLLCRKPAGTNGCGDCRSCHLLDSGTHPDAFLVSRQQDAKDIQVDQIRELSAKLQLSALLGSYRVGRIEPAEAMNRNAANALLKTLEEPPDNVILLLVADHAGRLPATILSRCQNLMIRPPKHVQARDWLSDQCSDHSNDALEIALKAAGGAPLEALRLLNDDDLGFAGQVRDRLDLIARGQPIEPELLEQWAKTPNRTWYWLSYWNRHHLQACLSPAALGDGSPSAHLTHTQAECLAALWQDAIEVQRRMNTHLRQELAIGKWLLQWQRATRAGS